jgi:hypothetical protein
MSSISITSHLVNNSTLYLYSDRNIKPKAYQTSADSSCLPICLRVSPCASERLFILHDMLQDGSEGLQEATGEERHVAVE